MFVRVGQLINRWRRLVLLIWAAVFVAGMAAGGAVMPRLVHEEEGSTRLESVQVMDRLDDMGVIGTEVVGVVDGIDTAGPAVATDVADTAGRIETMTGVASVIDYARARGPGLVSPDGRTGLVLVTLDEALDADGQQTVGDAVRDELHAIGSTEVLVGGEALMAEEFQVAAEKDMQRGEMIALPIALLAMVIIFGGVIAAGLPLVIALAAVAGSMFVLLAATALLPVSVFAINVVTMLGIGLGIDYGLLLVSRFREERGAGHEVAAAVERTVATAGVTITFSALTVAVALAGLFAFDNPTMRSFAIGGIGVVLTAMVAGLTLLPALLGTFGSRIKPSTVAATDTGRFYRLARAVQRRAVPVAVLASVGLALLAVPFLGARFELGDARSLPRSSEVRAAALTVAEQFPTHGIDPVIVVADVDAGSPELSSYTASVAAMPDVAAVTVRPDTPTGVSVVEVLPDGAGQSDVAQGLVATLRGTDAGFPTQVGGGAAFLVDFKDSTAERLPYALGIVAVATFVLLFLMTGSLAVPAKAIVMNLLSLGASFGALVWVFQEGHLSGLLGFESTGSLEVFIPVLIFIFAFGLSMDYEVFLLSRVKEIYDESGDSDHAVAVALQRTGRVITSAAFLIVVVFAGFAAGEVMTIKQLGFGMALAVLVDATVVRAILVPATMKLLGDWNWWAPEPLRRLHARIGLHEPPSTAGGRPDDLQGDPTGSEPGGVAGGSTGTKPVLESVN